MTEEAGFGRSRSLTRRHSVVIPSRGLKAVIVLGAIEPSLGEFGGRDVVEHHQFSCLTEVCGLASLQLTVDPAAFERANYIRTLQSCSA
jgi:hypothetical protein